MNGKRARRILTLIISPTQNILYGIEKGLCEQTASSDSYVCFHAGGLVTTKEHPVCNECELVLVNQCQAKTIIRRRIESLSVVDKSFIVWTHGNRVAPYDHFPSEEIEDLINKDKLIHCSEFHHNGCSDPEKIMTAFQINNNQNDIANILGKYTSIKTVTDIHGLRRKVLTPLVALDLLTQAEIKDDQLKGEIKNTITDQTYDENYRQLCQHLFEQADFELDKNGVNLSTVIGQIRGQDDPLINHAVLKAFADKIEDRIAELEKQEMP